MPPTGTTALGVAVGAAAVATAARVGTASSDSQQMRDTLEDLAQQLSKTFKDASKLRIRRNQPPQIVKIQIRLEKALESKVVLAEASPAVIESLKALSTAMRTVVKETRDEAGGPPPPPNEQWATLEKRLLKSYENLAGLMRSEGMHVPMVRNFKLARSLYHASSALSVVACAELLWSGQDLIIISSICCSGSWTMEVLKSHSDVFKRVMFKLLGAISRDGEQHTVNSATWYLTSLLMLSLLFGKLPSCMGALALGVGDPAAALVGSKLGSVKLYGKKTLEGSLAFFGVSFLFFVAYMQLLYALPWAAVLQLSAVGALCGALAELYCPVPTVDDNLFVPVATAAAVTYVLNSQGDSFGLPGGATPYAASTFDWSALLASLPLPLDLLPFDVAGLVSQGLPPPAPGVFAGTAWAPLYALVPAKPYFVN